MKKLFYLIFASLLILGACSQNNDNVSKADDKKSESKTDSKSNDTKKEKKSDNKKKETKEKETTKENQQDNSNNVTNSDNQQLAEKDQQDTEENVNAGLNANQTQNNNHAGSSSDHEPTKEEIFKWDKENIPGGTDYGLIDPEDVKSEDVADSEDVEDDESDTKDVNAEINAAQTEDEYYNALRKKYNGGLSSGELQTKQAIEQGYYDGDDADEVYQKIQDEEAKIDNGEYDQYKQ